MRDAPFFIDVNIAMYAAGKSHPYREACAWVLSEVANGNIPAVIDSETIQEILYRYGAIGRSQLAVTMATNLLDLIPIVLPVTHDDARTAIELYARHAHSGAKARHVVHAAVMQNNGISGIISVDKHFDHFPGIVRLDPQDLFAGRN